MTRTKKTLGRNWTRYHNYYGMNSVLEAVCTKQLHWDQAALREYPPAHAPEVNHQSASKHVHILPLCQAMMTMPGIEAIRSYQGAARLPRKQPQSSPRRQRRRAQGQEGTERCKDAARFQQGKPRVHRYRPGTVVYERFAGIKNRPSCSSGNCRSNDWWGRLPKT